MHRFFADDSGIAGGTARLNAEDSRHALRVLRLAAGDSVELVAAPDRYLAEVTDTDGERVAVRVIEKLRSKYGKDYARTTVVTFLLKLASK